jgi:glutamate 5-kinase
MNAEETGIELVGKIGSMALIRKEENDIDYNIISRLGQDLRPGMIWVSSGATEIGRLDYMRRTGSELSGDVNEVKTDYAAQGQSILMSRYREFVSPEYSIRQVLVEYTHFNDAEKREHIRKLLMRCPSQNAIPIVNYNDPVNDEENRKMELAHLRENGSDVVECVDNDETAAVVAGLVKAKLLVIMTSAEGIYRVPGDPSSLIREIGGRDTEELERNVRAAQDYCVGASRKGANGAKAKLEYALRAAKSGTVVIIGHAKYHLHDLCAGTVPHTRIGLI